MATARNPRQRPSSHISTFDCIICMEENLPSSSRFIMPWTKRCCKHCSSICRNCVALYINCNVEQGRSLVRCPMPKCYWAFDPISCRKLVAREIFDRWCDLLCESAVRDYERCYCPNLDCQEPIIDECLASLPEKIRCPNCMKSCCFRCSSPWDDRHECDDSYVVIEMEDWKRCPGCKYYVERIDGCNSIVCRCQTRFCYYCGAKEEESHYCPLRNSSRRDRIKEFIRKALLGILSLALGLWVCWFCFGPK